MSTASSVVACVTRQQSRQRVQQSETEYRKCPKATWVQMALRADDQRRSVDDVSVHVRQHLFKISHNTYFVNVSNSFHWSSGFDITQWICLWVSVEMDRWPWIVYWWYLTCVTSRRPLRCSWASIRSFCDLFRHFPTVSALSPRFISTVLEPMTHLKIKA